MSNPGKLSEEIFQKRILAEDPSAYIYEFEDYAKVNYGKGHFATKPPELVKSKPSDFLVTFFGETFFAEVKSVKDKDSFPFANLRKNQWKAGTKTTRAGGDYFVFLHFMKYKQWYKIPFSFILEWEKKSFRQEEIQEFKVNDW